jgi:hypothetical protein
MSQIFGQKRDAVAKSWSEMFEEDEEESELEAAMNKRREQNLRSWSQESRQHVAVRPGILTESKSHSSINARRSPTGKSVSPTKHGYGFSENEPFGGRLPYKRSPGKQVGADKWAALGNKRRNYQPAADKPALATKKRSMTTGSRKRPSQGSSGFEYSGFHRRGSREQEKSRPPWMEQDWRQQHKLSVDSSTDEDEHEWVGGLQFDLHL